MTYRNYSSKLAVVKKPEPDEIVVRNPVFRLPNNGPSLTQELSDKLCAAIQNHLYKEEACSACGVNYKTVAYWVKKGKRPGAAPLYAEFALKWLAADAQVHSSVSGFLYRKAQDGDTKAIVAMLDRRWPKTDNKSISEDSEEDAQGNAFEIFRDPPQELVNDLIESGITSKLLTAESVEEHEVHKKLEELGFVRVRPMPVAPDE